MNDLNGVDWLVGAILVVGGVNWGMIGLFDINLVSLLFGEMTFVSRAVYTLVGLSAVYIAGSALLTTTVTHPRTHVVRP